MSKYKTIATEFKSLESLKKALADLGITPEISSDVKKPSLHLIGYQGDKRPELANVVIRRKDVNRFSGGASNDIGFAWDESRRCYAAQVSDYDSRASAGLMQKVTQQYSFREIERQARMKGYTVKQEAQNDGTIKVVLTHR
jgi:hypothetical protein